MNDKLKLMYVDDEEINLLIFEKVFEKKYNVITAESGMLALELLLTHSDTVVVISDMKMPAMTGTQFIQKAKTKFPKIKFFILTGYDINDEIQEALESNLILNYFRKPFNFNQITSAIQKAIE